MNLTLNLPQTASADAQLALDFSQYSVACSIDIACPASTLYTLWSEVAHWPLWDPDTRWARLDGAFEAGSQGRIAPSKGFALNMLLTQATPDQRFTVICRVLGSVLHFPHELSPIPGGVRATHQVRFSGWLAPLLMKTVGAGVIRGLPLTMTRLRALAEYRHDMAQHG